MTTTATPTTPSPTAPAAVVVAALGRVQPGRLGRVLGALVDELGDRATLHVLHTGLDPLAVEAAVWAHPDVTFISAHRDHYEQFGPAGRARSELLLLDCLRVEGSERVVVAPVDPGAVRIVAAAATAPRPVPAAVPVGPGSGVAVTPPVPAPRLEVGASSSHVLVLDGALATRAVRRHVDLTLARARRNRKTLSLALEAAVALGHPRGLILRQHVIPNAVRPLVAVFTLCVGQSIVWASSLAFLGLGVAPPSSETCR